ncbi:inositol phospholipid synthesis and fat-storage-inducing TM-domain-containing protein, partial [Vararia minispora EC-137]
MPELRAIAAAMVSMIVSLGTVYSILHSTFLDTSNPFITNNHHLSGTHYFASKTNLLNTVFLKRAWGWTTVFFLPLFLTAAPQHRLRRAAQYLVATISWLAFTAWFFGPALLERVTLLTGGICLVHLEDCLDVPVPVEYCLNRERISYASHPHLFPTPFQAFEGSPRMPRLRRGHDVSGHIFLLTLSALFLGDQIRQSILQTTRRRRSWPLAYALFGAQALFHLWLISLWITSVYYHTAAEKFSGLALGFAVFGITQVPLWLSRE